VLSPPRVCVVTDGGSVEPLQTYLVECYWPRVTEEKAAAVADRARLAIAELASAGTVVNYLGSLLVPEDEVVFYLFEGSSAEAVRAVGRLAEIPYERVLLSKEQRSDDQS
jgi:hypothetical protein